MLHELLLALLGYTGDLIIDVREQQEQTGTHIPLSPDAPISHQHTFKLAPDISFIQPSERDVIERIITLGFYYRELDRFAAKSRNLSWIRSPNESPLLRTSQLLKGKTSKHSVYRRAIANGIVEVLSVYRSVVLHIEQKLLSDSLPIVATLTQGLNKFFVLLPPLFELILEIERDNIYGGKLLNLLHKRCHCGVPELQICIQRLLWHGHQVMYNQLASWAVYGILHDPYKEFYISSQDDKDSEQESAPQFLEKLTRLSVADTSLNDWHLGFHISLESSEFHKRSFENAIDTIKTVAASHLWQLVVVRADLNGHLKALKDYFLLEKGDFFQSFLEESRQLMRLPPRQSTAEADLMVPFQLAALKTIGEEDKYFSRVSLRMPSFGITLKPSPVDLSKVKVNKDGDSVGHPDASLEVSLDGWDGISLEYSIDWPLQLFVTPEVLSKYQRIFQYLLRLKRTQMELEKSWAFAMHQDHIDFAKLRNDSRKSSVSQHRRQRLRPMWHVREHMAFLIRNLQFYIQVDVIESQWNVLQSHIQNSHDFTELVGFHQEYLAALISQSFLDIGSVSRILDGIMKLCLQFCWKIENDESNRTTSELEHIAEEFNKKSNSLYTILRSSRLAGSQRAPFLRQFLLRLNFNSFFEATARGVLNVVSPRPPVSVLQ
ncbi:gamma-tubulin complex component 4 isoform X4 [Capsicum annuum]|uniref:gamma-tubulin complex component 4 isoform X4 n=1 Tax=Capsicum annuum TaxID=4072 RepID=UPI001FB0C4E9|nr:gamma-tubulin complex component 4 isoform X4 [Capsicum annuum]